MKTKNRWLVALSAVGIHLSIGSVYAYSAWKMPLGNALGWKSTQTALAFSIAIFFLGLSAAFLGKVIERKGPRVGSVLSALFFCGGLALSGLACQLESRMLFYLGYGVVGGVGLGLGYIAPVPTLVRWFPDRRGLATGLAIMGFGFGGLVCAKLIDVLVPPVLDAGTVVYKQGDIVTAFFVLAGIYLLIMIPSAWYLEPPPEGYARRFAGKHGREARLPARDTSAKEALRSFRFYGLWMMLFLNVTCGISLIATAKTMGVDMVHLPVQQASLLVMGISLFNGLGRICWAAMSDRIGRPNTFIAFFVIQIIAFPLLPHLIAYPAAFMAVIFLVITCYGGGFATLPAFISDLFGLNAMPTINGFLLTAWSMAGFVGPMVTADLHERTGTYTVGLSLCGVVFMVALVLALLMKRAVRRDQNVMQAEGSGSRSLAPEASV